jgi:hypothetical protein
MPLPLRKIASLFAVVAFLSCIGVSDVLAATTFSTGSITTDGTLTVNGDVNLNDSSADTLLIGQNGGTPDTVTLAGNLSLTDSQWAVTTAGSATFATVNALTFNAGTDGFSLSGGGTSRTLSVTGGDKTLQGSGTTITLGGNLSLADAFTTAGNFPLTLTTTGTTSIVLPVSGTLATLSGTETLSNKTFSSSAWNGQTIGIGFGGTGTTTAPSDGRLLIGKTDGTYAVAGITAGSGISVTNGNGTITIANTNLPPFVDTTMLIKGSVDATKQIRFEVDSLTTGTVRVLTVPDADIILNAAADISGTTLASNVVTSSLTSVGALSSGSIATGFGAISTANNISTSGSGTITSAGALTASNGFTVVSGTISMSGGTIAGTTPLIFDGTTADANKTTFAITDPTGSRTISFPNLTGTVALSTNNLSLFATTTSSQLAGVISDETGTGALVFASGPSLVAPVLGAATATSINGLAITASTGTLTIANGKTLTVNSSLAFTGTDGTTFTFPGSSDTVVTLNATQTLTNKTLTSPKIGTSILDTNGNELFKLTATASAVNEITYANAATANNPTFTASGDDTNIGINLTPKGSGVINLKGPATVMAGTGTATPGIGGKLFASATAVGTPASTVETDLIAYSLPANSLSSNGMGLRIRAWGTTGANGNQKTVNLYFGSTILIASPTAGANNKDWVLEAVLLRSGTTSQGSIGGGQFNGTTLATDYTAPAETLSGAVTVKVTGKNNNATANDIVAQGMLIEYIGQ